MTIRWMKRTILGGLAAGALAISGCTLLQPVQEVTRYYILDTTDYQPVIVEPAENRLTVGVNRVRLARYLESPGMAVRERSHALSYSGRHRWAEPLDVMTARILSENLTREGGVRLVVVFPLQRRTVPDVDLDVSISRAEGVIPTTGGAHAIFRATWELRAGRQAERVASGAVQRDDLPWNGSDFDQLAASLSSGVRELTRQIAEALAAEPDASARE
jgi:uncharacterized lipoprotein YmbA